MTERKPMTLGERWRREATRGISDRRLELALEVMPSIRKPMVRIRRGSIVAEMEGAMGSIHEVSIHVRTLPMKDWPTVLQVLRRSRSIVEGLEQGRVPRSFDRLVARVCGEPLFPDSRRVSWGCTCGNPENPCHHVLALHELFARRLEERPWELLVLRGVDVHEMLGKVRQGIAEQGLPSLPFGATEEPVLYPHGEDGDLDFTLAPSQVSWLVGAVQSRWVEAAAREILSYTGPMDGDPSREKT